MADEDGISQAKLAADLDHVVSVSGQSRILSFIVRSQVRTTCSYVVKQNGPEIRLERWRDKPPHILIAAEPMGEHHRFLADALNIYIIAFDNSWHLILAPWAAHLLILSALGLPCDCSLWELPRPIRSRPAKRLVISAMSEWAPTFDPVPIA